jgi:hypothetical protein
MTTKITMITKVDGGYPAQSLPREKTLCFFTGRARYFCPILIKSKELIDKF